MAVRSIFVSRREASSAFVIRAERAVFVPDGAGRTRRVGGSENDDGRACSSHSPVSPPPSARSDESSSPISFVVSPAGAKDKVRGKGLGDEV